MGQVVSFFEAYNSAENFPPEFQGGIEELVHFMRPSKPVYLFRPDILQDNTCYFLENFRGKSLYALKTNPHPKILKTLWDAGVHEFDVASINEIRLLSEILPQAEMHFMHPIKSREAIRESYFKHHIRTFVLDHEVELQKIIEETDNAQDLTLFVRMALPKNESAGIDFSNKFGARFDQAIALLQKARRSSIKLGLSFHVGTQTLDAQVYAHAIARASRVIKTSGVAVECLNIGGGFAVSYPGSPAPDLAGVFQIIDEAVQNNDLSHMELMAEPGRILVSESGSLLTRVELRKESMLYLNDGTYGGLFDAGPVLGERFPVKGLSVNRNLDESLSPYSFAGPTCDSLDMMAGPFLLPENINEGDWIEIGNLGAYSQALRTDFNGFGHADFVTLRA